ncbi:GDSL esterase/lipase At1g28590 isoform X1 [Amborella trichopoda]|nr:GDSL esterase/lipase At1g28590 isoform X1 [Amborella trichopoda]|eukprot:XP_011623527.1 GDSL esterase/lipase At1g28590 isoform X1 [Amborella trichopoda]
MASMRFSLIFGFSLYSCLFAAEAESNTSSYAALFSFGDSLADTGNMLSLQGQSSPIGRLPYGETFFHRPTGRFSDGRLVVDFFAQALGLPLLPAYLSTLDGGDDFSKGVNFAVGGATALDSSSQSVTNISLNAQLQWFHQLLPSICKPYSDCKEFMKKSMFLVGEIGGNDCNFAFFQGKSTEEVKAFVPSIINTIMKAASEFINEGVETLVIPGNLPIGCSTAYLTMFQTQDKQEYDPDTGCLKRFNDFAIYYNSKLQDAIQVMRQKFPHATTIYADYYNAALRFFKSPEAFGLAKETVHSACCGVGDRYNFNFNRMCGTSGVTACSDPASYISWDGMHLTETAYKFITASLLSGEFTDPPLRIGNLDVALPPLTMPNPTSQGPEAMHVTVCVYVFLITSLFFCLNELNQGFTFYLDIM